MGNTQYAASPSLTLPRIGGGELTFNLAVLPPPPAWGRVGEGEASDGCPTFSNNRFNS